MDPEQLQVIIGYAAFVSLASLILRVANPHWTQTRIAFLTGGLLPRLGLGYGALAFLRWMLPSQVSGGIDHHAMGIIGIIIILFLSLACLVAGMFVSLVVTSIVRPR